jgi:hypothetical protein
MNSTSLRALLAACGLLAGTAVAATAFAAGPVPIDSASRGARAVVTTALLRMDAQTMDWQFVSSSRDMVERALRQFNALTSYASLAASHGTVSYECPSGSVSARVTNVALRVVRLEWNQCSDNDPWLYQVIDGPAEVTLLSGTLAPASVISIRFGDRQRDHVIGLLPGPEFPVTETSYGGTTTYRNLRLTGVIPMARSELNGFFTGRYTVAVTGFFHFVDHASDVFLFGPPYYDHDHVVSTDGAVLSGETINPSGYVANTEFTLVAGKITERYHVPATPTYPDGNTLTKFVRGTNLRVQYGFSGDQTGANNTQTIDGTVEADYSQFWGFNCPAPDNFTYRTLATLTSPSSYYTGTFSAGQLQINGNTKATFTATGSNPYVDLVGHVALDIGGVGHFNYDVPDYLFGGPLYAAAQCSGH